MKRQVPGLAATARDSHSEVPDGMFLVRVDHAQARWYSHKRFYVLRLSILEPKLFAWFYKRGCQEKTLFLSLEKR